MSSDLKAFLIGWGILIAFLVIRYFVRNNNYQSQDNYNESNLKDVTPKKNHLNLKRK